MASTYYGVVRGHRIVLPEGTDLEDGTVVEIRVLDSSEGEEDRLSPNSPLAQALVASGLMLEVKPPLTSMPDGDRTPIKVTGEPLSETIIRDRR